MKFNNKEIETLREIKNDYLNKEIDDDFIHYILETSCLNTNRKLKLVNNKKYEKPFVDMETGKMFINLNCLKDYVLKLKEITKLNNMEIYNDFMIITLLHEFVHLEQFYDIKENNYPEITRLFNKVFTAKLDDYSIYDKLGNHFFYERMANLIAYREISLIEETKLKEYFKGMVLDVIANGYNIKFGMTPSRLTLMLLNQDYDINSINIPLRERILYGLDLTMGEYIKLFDQVVSNENIEEVDISKILKLIR